MCLFLCLIRIPKFCDGSINPAMEQVCGRPLGLKFNEATCDLYIGDAYFGLLVVGYNGGVAKQVVTSAEGVPFRFTNALDIDQNTGVIYFTDTSTIFQRWYVSSIYSLYRFFVFKFVHIVMILIPIY